MGRDPGGLSDAGLPGRARAVEPEVRAEAADRDDGAGAHTTCVLQEEGVGLGHTQFLPTIGEDGHGAVGFVVIALRLRLGVLLGLRV